MLFPWLQVSTGRPTVDNVTSSQTAPPNVLQVGPLKPSLADTLRLSYSALELPSPPDERAAFLAEHAGSITAAVTSGRTGVDAALISALPHLGAIVHFGVGYDTTDIDAAAARGIAVSNTPDVLTDCVADTAVGLMIDTLRQFSAADRYLRAGRWTAEGKPADPPGERQPSDASRRGVFVSSPVVEPAVVSVSGSVDLRVTDAWVEHPTHIQYTWLFLRREVKDSAYRLITHLAKVPHSYIAWTDLSRRCFAFVDFYLNEQRVGVSGDFAHEGLIYQSTVPIPDTVRLRVVLHGHVAPPPGAPPSNVPDCP